MAARSLTPAALPLSAELNPSLGPRWSVPPASPGCLPRGDHQYNTQVFRGAVVFSPYYWTCFCLAVSLACDLWNYGNANGAFPREAISALFYFTGVCLKWNSIQKTSIFCSSLSSGHDWRGPRRQTRSAQLDLRLLLFACLFGSFGQLTWTRWRLRPATASCGDEHFMLQR